MADTLNTIGNRPVLVCEPDGKKVTSERDALDLVEEMINSGVEWVVIPVERLDENFFQLKTGLAGQIVQKFVTYKRRLVVLGDISQYEESSRAFRDFVREANRGNQFWFLSNLQELNTRLNRAE